MEVDSVEPCMITKLSNELLLKIASYLTPKNPVKLQLVHSVPAGSNPNDCDQAVEQGVTAKPGAAIPADLLNLAQMCSKLKKVVDDTLDNGVEYHVVLPCSSSLLLVVARPSHKKIETILTHSHRVRISGLDLMRWVSGTFPPLHRHCIMDWTIHLQQNTHTGRLEKSSIFVTLISELDWPETRFQHSEVILRQIIAAQQVLNSVTDADAKTNGLFTPAHLHAFNVAQVQGRLTPAMPLSSGSFIVPPRSVIPRYRDIAMQRMWKEDYDEVQGKIARAYDDYLNGKAGDPGNVQLISYLWVVASRPR